jgi:hypothetical protein
VRTCCCGAGIGVGANTGSGMPDGGMQATSSGNPSRSGSDLI